MRELALLHQDRLRPFKIEGPAVISFSGGRTSALMLYLILKAHDGKLPADVFPVFENTGKERVETLDFVRDCGEHWGVKVHWAEYRDDARGFADVDWQTASRDGSPFAALIKKRNFLPNPVTRFCTQELKIRVMKRWMLERGFEHWTNVVGLRYDEPARVATQRAGEGRERWDLDFPLYAARYIKRDVLAFWDAQPFNLQLREWEGNCDMCFLKGAAKRERIMRDDPKIADWWIAQERLVKTFGGKNSGNAGRFRKEKGGSYEDMLKRVQSMPHLPGIIEDPPDADDDIGDCMCSGAA